MAKAQRKVLIVDDDLGMLKLLEKWLKVAGYHVIEASNGKTAIRKAKEEQPDCILLDILMPKMDGREVARRLKAEEETQEIPVVFMTVCIDLKDDKGKEEIEVDGIKYHGFAKPLHNMKLLSIIRKAINRRLHNNQ